MSEESKTPELAEIIRGIFESTDREWDLDALLSYAAPDVVWDLSPVGFGTYEGVAAIGEFLTGYAWEATGVGQSFEGEAAIRGLYEDWVGGYEEHEIVLEEGKALGHGVVFADLTQGGCLAGSTGDVRSREGWIFRFVDGRIVWVTGMATLVAAERLAEARE